MEMTKRTMKLLGADISEYVIVSMEESLPSEKTGAKELKKYIELTTGAKLDIVDGTAKADREIIVGKSDRETGALAFDRAPLEEDGYVIRTEGTKLLIAGGSRRGGMYGVYEFIERYMGWRFFTNDLEMCKAPETIEVGEINESYTPIFEYRELDWVCARPKEWAVKAHINGNYRDFGPEYGGELRWGGAIHSMSKYFDGVQDKQPCLSDPENIAHVIKKIEEELEEKPWIELFEISQNDNQNDCQCERCKKINEEEGSRAGTTIHFMNALSDGLREKFPKLKLQTFAYQYTRKPPKTKCRDNIVIKLCPMEMCPNHAFTDDSCWPNSDFKRDLEGWNEKASKIYVWDYSVNYSWFHCPFPNLKIMPVNMRWFADNNVKGYYPEANYISNHCEFAELRSYLHAKLMWNPYMPEEEYYAHMHEFMEAYYGPGWKNILNWIDFTSEAASKNHCDLFSDPFEVIKLEDYKARYEDCKKWWEDAENMAKETGDKDLVDRVHRSSIQWRFVKLCLEYNDRFVKGDRDKQLWYVVENQNFYNDTVKYNSCWKEGYAWPPKLNFRRPPIEWAHHHFYGTGVEFDWIFTEAADRRLITREWEL